MQDLETIARNIVSSDVHYCVSSLVHDLAQHDNEIDELQDVMTRDNWIDAVFEHVANLPHADLAEAREYIRDNDLLGDTDKAAIDLSALEAANLLSEDEETARDFAEEQGIDPHVDEALEHWIVSGFLADELEQKGEMILRDWHGLTIWGRTTSGQSIDMDSVIEHIARDLRDRTS